MNLDFSKSIEVLGGYPIFKFVEITDVEFLQKSKSLINQAIVLKNGVSWSVGIANPKTLELTFDPEDRTGSNILDVKVEAFICADDISSDLLDKFNYMQTRRFIVLLRDEDSSKIVGTIDTPLKFKFSYSSGKSGKDPKGYKFTFYNKMLIPPRVYCPI